MDFTFTEEQQAAVEAAKAVFTSVTPDAVPSPALTPGAVSEDLDRSLWSRLAAADLLGLVLPPSTAAPDSTPSRSASCCANPPASSPAYPCWKRAPWP